MAIGIAVHLVSTNPCGFLLWAGGDLSVPGTVVTLSVQRGAGGLFVCAGKIHLLYFWFQTEPSLPPIGRTP